MPIKIKKPSGAVITQREIVNTVSVVETTQKASAAKDPSLEYWSHMPLLHEEPKVCPFCKHVYRMPCKEGEQQLCQNYLFLTGQLKE